MYLKCIWTLFPNVYCKFSSFPSPLAPAHRSLDRHSRHADIQACVVSANNIIPLCSCDEIDPFPNSVWRHWFKRHFGSATHHSIRCPPSVGRRVRRCSVRTGGSAFLRCPVLVRGRNWLAAYVFFWELGRSGIMSWTKSLTIIPKSLDIGKVEAYRTSKSAGNRNELRSHKFVAESYVQCSTIETRADTTK